MKKTYKLIAETTNGVTLVDSFDDFHGIEIIDEEAIQEAIYNFVVNKGYYTSVCLVECEGESIEDFYEMEEKQGGYNPFWDMKESK